MSSTLRDKQIGLDLSQQAVLLGDLQQLAKMNRNQQNQALGFPLEGADDMQQIVLGDSNTTHTVTTPTTNTSSNSSWLPGLLGAGLIASGIGAPVGLGLVAQALPGIIKSLTPPAAAAPALGVNTTTTENVSVDMQIDPPK